jgi:hypothetical protein
MSRRGRLIDFPSLAVSAHTSNRARLALRAAVFTTILALLGGSLAGLARADGDPASDVLASGRLFLPQDAGVGAARQAQLSALLAAAQRAGYPIRVALIASSADLGSVTALWRQPQSYARFLGQELALVNTGPLLVVMPNGVGEYRFRGALPGGRGALAGIGAPGTDLATAALTAVQRLAAADGHALALPAVAAPAGSGSSSDTGAWIAFVTGAALILAAWTASLRARPLQLRRKRATPT